MAQNIVKKYFQSDGLKRCLDYKFTINEAFLDKLHGRVALLPERLESSLRAKLKNGDSAAAKSEFIRHVEDAYKEENVSELCNYLDELSTEYPNYADVAKEIRRTFTFEEASEDRIDLTSKSSKTALGATPPAVHGKPEKGLKPSFVIMTANENEFEAACHFLQWPDENEIFFNEKMIQKQNVSFTGDPSLRKQVKEIEAVPGETYKVFSVGEKQGILMRCTNMGGFTREGSNWHTFKLLRDAKENGWPLETILIVGCCGSRSANGRVPEGTILVAEHINQYLIGKMEKDGIHYEPLSHSTSKDWTRFIEQNMAPQSAQKSHHVSELHKSIMFSGDFVVKDVPTAEQLRGDRRRVGFEMEGLGVISAVDVFKEFFSAGFQSPDVVLLKGVSDNAGEDKNDPKDTIFFSETVRDVDEKTRQHMCTVMSLTLVLRAIINKWG